jgi:23S rRNA maturation mini-RNase III
MAEDIDQPEDNEAIRAAKRAKNAKANADAREVKSIGWKTAAGIGIGSAAVVAALIYANKARKKDEG